MVRPLPLPPPIEHLHARAAVDADEPDFVRRAVAERGRGPAGVDVMRLAGHRERGSCEQGDQTKRTARVVEFPCAAGSQCDRQRL